MTAAKKKQDKIEKLRATAIRKQEDACRQEIADVLEKHECAFDLSVTHFSDQRRAPQFDINIKALPKT